MIDRARGDIKKQYKYGHCIIQQYQADRPDVPLFSPKLKKVVTFKEVFIQISGWGSGVAVSTLDFRSKGWWFEA